MFWSHASNFKWCGKTPGGSLRWVVWGRNRIRWGTLELRIGWELPNEVKIILLILFIRDLDTVSNELQYMRFDKPYVLTVKFYFTLLQFYFTLFYSLEIKTTHNCSRWRPFSDPLENEARMIIKARQLICIHYISLLTKWIEWQLNGP